MPLFFVPYLLACASSSHEDRSPLVVNSSTPEIGGSAILAPVALRVWRASRRRPSTTKMLGPTRRAVPAMASIPASAKALARRSRTVVVRLRLKVISAGPSIVTRSPFVNSAFAKRLTRAKFLIAHGSSIGGRSLEPSLLVYLQATILKSPAVERRLRDLKPSADFYPPFGPCASCTSACRSRPMICSVV